MKKVMACAMAILLLLGCVCAHAEEEEGLTEVRCDKWHFSVRIPSGMKTTSYDCENTEFEVLDGGGLCISPEGTGGMPQVWILRRDHAFNNPPLYLTDFFWQYLHDDSDEIFDEDGYGLYRYGGITLYGSGCRFYGDNDEILYREFRCIPYRDDRGTEFVVRFTEENRDEAYALLDTVIRSYLPDEEPEEKEAKFRPVPQEIDLINGTYRVRFEDVDRIKTDGYFTAVLCTTDHYSEEDLRSMRPGDTLMINGRVHTLKSTDDPWESDDGTLYEMGFTTDQWAPQQSLYGFTFEKDEFADGYLLYVMDDWYSVSRAAAVRIDLSGPIAHYDVPGGGEPELINENMLDDESGITALTQMAPYNTTCTFEDGKLVRIDSASYPVGPVDPFIPAPME